MAMARHKVAMGVPMISRASEKFKDARIELVAVMRGQRHWGSLLEPLATLAHQHRDPQRPEADSGASVTMTPKGNMPLSQKSDARSHH